MAHTIEQLVAHSILQGSDAMFGRFLDVTAGAQQRFEQQDWSAVQLALKQRIHFYDHHVALVTNQLKTMLGKRYANRRFLMQVKACYEDLLIDYPRYDIAESFFNSIYCRIFEHRHIDEERLFIYSSQDNRSPIYPTPLCRHYSEPMSLSERLLRVFQDTPFTLPWLNLTQDIQFVIQTLMETLTIHHEENIQIEIIKEPFYRNKAAYLVGKMIHNDIVMPLIFPIVINNNRLQIDACVFNTNDASILFGFARSYFMVYAPAPAALVEFLSELLPNKTKAELYTAIGCQKHGKTELYRDFLHHIQHSTDQFVLAAGIKGMVMSVFTLPSYDFVFKVIKDKFAPQKNITHAEVKSKYQLVKEHDRVGRMADTQEYSNFYFDRHRFHPELLEELLKVAPSLIKLTKDHVIIAHLYMERRMIPLNLYLDNANDSELCHAINEYGLAIKQLAAANIFPGDMLFKNFGVTRHKRVIFYDYDEISYMTDMNFRSIPPARYPEDELAAEPWYSVGLYDVFPEEFRHFLLINPKLKRLFNQLHQELFKPSFWISLQKDILSNTYHDVFPYPNRCRLHTDKRTYSVFSDRGC